MPRLIRFLIFLILYSQEGLAQRGALFDGSAGLKPVTPLSGFPGSFDTETAQRNSWVVDFPPVAELSDDFFTSLILGAPLASIQYGVTDNLSIGTNPLTAFPLIAGIPLLYLKSRYSFFSSPKFAAVLNTGVGLIPSKKNQMSLVSFGSNSSYFFDEKSWVNFFFNAFYANLRIGEPASANYLNLTSKAFYLGGGYQNFVTSWLGPQVTLLIPVIAEGHLETSGRDLSARINPDYILSSTVIRVSTDVVLGNWLLTPGLLWGVGSLWNDFLDYNQQPKFLFSISWVMP